MTCFGCLSDRYDYSPILLLVITFNLKLNQKYTMWSKTIKKELNGNTAPADVEPKQRVCVVPHHIHESVERKTTKAIIN